MLEDKKNDNIDVAYVSNLARIHLTDNEIETFQNQLSSVLDYINKINELDLTGIEPTNHACLLKNIFRKDEVKAELDHDAVMKNAPASANGQFLVPKIMD